VLPKSVLSSTVSASDASELPPLVLFNLVVNSARWSTDKSIAATTVLSWNATDRPESEEPPWPACRI
jgi:hypothetical protein